jgi:hypothetical protein
MNTEENDRPRTVPGLIEHQGADAATAAREDLRAARRRTKRSKAPTAPMGASLSAALAEMFGDPDPAPAPAENDTAAVVSSELEEGGDPLEGLAARIAAEGRPELALDPLVTAAAVLKTAGVVALLILMLFGLSLCLRAVDLCRRRRRAARPAPASAGPAARGPRGPGPAPTHHTLFIGMHIASHITYF